MKAVAFFVSPHGFGHAARTCAVIDAILRRRRSVRFHIFTTIPEWFFTESLNERFVYHPFLTDVGLVQFSPLEEDLSATVRALDEAPWRDGEAVQTLAHHLRDIECRLVLADISPLGLSVARCAGLPSVLVENFTWDWIYQHIDGPDELEAHGQELAAVFAATDLRIQTHPVCHRVTGAIPSPRIARSPRRSRAEVRRSLGVPPDEPLVLASMGGLSWDYGRLENLAGREGPWVAVPGGAPVEERRGKLVLLPFHSSFYHPDLVRACDVVVGKLGYSTVAEAVQAGAAFAYVERPRFPESQFLADDVERNLTAARIEREAFVDCDWMPVVEDLLVQERKDPEDEIGADEAARMIVERFPEVFEKQD